MKAAKKKATQKTAKSAPKKSAKKKAATKSAPKKKAAVKKAAAKKTAKTAPAKPSSKPVAAKKKATVKKAAVKKTAKKAPAKPSSKPVAAKKKAAVKKAAVKKTAKTASAKPSSKPVAAKKKAAKKAAPKKVAKKNAVKKTVPKKAAKKAVSTAKPKKKAAQKKAVRKTASVSKPIPSILLEGDSSPAARQSGPGSRYELGPDAHRPLVGDDLGELPEAYGTGMVMASARDPHWLYVFWDLTDEQQNEYNRASRDKHLIVRLLNVAQGNRVVSETHVHPESRNWFIPAPIAGAQYQVELGYNDKQDQWQQVSQSRPVATPPDKLSQDTGADFATLPSEIPFEQLMGIVRQVVAENVPLLEALEQLRAEGFANLPGPGYFKDALLSAGEEPENLTPEQREALAEVVSMDEVRRVWIGSQEITELVRRQLTTELSSRAAAARQVSSLSSPFGGEGGEKDFWFNVNAELIIYGATEPDATVTIGGRQIRLREDGSFSFRFALPDGDYDLPIQATSADGDDSRNADLSFHRGTQYRGEVGTHPQDERLQTPRPEHTA